MPFVTDIHPPVGTIEAAAGLGLALGGRKGKGLFGKKQYEALEVLSRFYLPLRTITWDRGEEGSTGLVVDPQGIITGSIAFQPPPGGPETAFGDNMEEEEFLTFCKNLAKEAVNFFSETEEYPGLVTDPNQALPLLKDDNQGIANAGLPQTIDPAQIVEQLRAKIAEYDRSSAAWTELQQKLVANRDQLAQKIEEEENEARAAGEKSLEELEQQVQSELEAKNRETEEAAEAARQEHAKQKELIQSELERLKQQAEEDSSEELKKKIKAEEQNLSAHDRKLAATLDQLKREEAKYAKIQQERIKQKKTETEKQLTAYKQRLNLLDAAIKELQKGVDKRLERCSEQCKKISGLAVTLPEGQCDQEFPLIFYAARYPDNRWQIFPPQNLAKKGLGGKLSGLFGDLNLPFRPVSKLVETMAGALQNMLPGHELEARLVEQNLLEDSGFLQDAKAGLEQLINQEEVEKKHANLFEGY